MENDKIIVFRFIELMLYWEGRVNTNTLQLQFGKSRQQNSAYLKDYFSQKNNNHVSYDASLKAYVAQDAFVPLFLDTNIQIYLAWLESGTFIHAARQNIIDTLKIPERHVSHVIVRKLITAIKESRRIDVDYVSLNNPNNQGRIIVPHHIVKAGTRWHLRAWCEKSQEYRDFVLSRFRGIPDLLEKSPQNALSDSAWNTNVTVILQADSRLSQEKRTVIESDYAMVDGYLKITTRGCLVNYLLREMQVSIKMLDGNPEAQQLVLVNLIDIKPWLFEG